VLSASAPGRDLSGCECPPRCSNVIHKTTDSSSRLSDTITNYYLSHENNDTEIGRRYVNAVETRSRVASSLLRDVLGHLEKLATAYQRLKAVLAVDLVEHRTSVPGQIHASIDTIVQQTQNSLAEFSSQIADKFTDYYKQNADFSVKQLEDIAGSILSHQTYVAIIHVNDAASFNSSRTQKILHDRDAFCEALGAVFGHLKLNRGANFSTKLFVDRTCNQSELTEYCSELRPFTRNETGYIRELVEVYRTMAESARTTLKCVPMYRTFLNEVELWLKQALTLNSSLPLQPADRRHVLTELENELSRLKEISHTVAAESLVISFSTKNKTYTNVTYVLKRVDKNALLPHIAI